ncbi:MAG: ribonuclease D [Gammaproteobacteria bacterium]|nr:ribonuclease D [Gammaproteobacteria bacterium]
MTVNFINNEAELISFCQQISDTIWMTVDTEFLREKTYYPQLCLIQVATEDHIACIDPLALSDLTPILDLIYSPEITVIFHAARQDLELLYLLRNSLPTNVFDTQIAATVLGYGDQIGYGNLVKQCLDVDLDKAHSRTDWTQRPLDPAQIEYAADDVRYLRDVYKLLLQQLEQKNRSHWLHEDFANLVDLNSYRIEPETMWRKIKGAGRLKGVQLATLQRLAAWREYRAVKSNRPRRWILKDDVLIDLARLAPDSIEKFSMIRGLESGTIDRHGKALLDEIKQAKALPKEQWPTFKKTQPLTNQQDAIVDALMALLRKYCDDQAIAPVAVASRKDIERMVAGETDLPLQQGWRNEIVGHHLQAFLGGKLAITADTTTLYTQEKG